MAGRVLRARHCDARCEKSCRKSCVTRGESITVKFQLRIDGDGRHSAVRHVVKCASIAPSQKTCQSSLSAKPFSIRHHIAKLPVMPDPSRYYILGAFLLGIALATAWNSTKSEQKDVRDAPEPQPQQDKKHIVQLSKIKYLDALKNTHANHEKPSNNGVDDVKDGIEGCIGNTPLIRIKSLSEATGCEILAKAEVRIASS